MNKETIIHELEQLNLKLKKANLNAQFEFTDKLKTSFKYGIFFTIDNFKSLYFSNNNIQKLFLELNEYLENANLGI